MPSTTKNISETLKAIQDFLTKKFRDRAKVDFYKPSMDEQTVPAVLLDIELLNDGEDKGDERLPVECSMNAYCVMSADIPEYLLASMDFAVETMKYVRQNNWNLTNSTMPKAIEAAPSDFVPGLPGVECWVVTWQQTFYFGVDCWKSDLPAPTTVKFSYSPDIGLPHEGDYFEL